MATDEERLREHILAKAVEHVPKAFLLELQERIRRAYIDEFLEVQHKPTTISQQRLFKLNQVRCFRIDWELCEAAKAHNLPATANPLPSNKWHHAYVITGAFGLTQSYVPNAGDFPQPARFRESLAEASNCPRLPLDEPAEIYALKEFYALLAHTPVGRSFSEDHQRLGTLAFCVPDRTMKRWAASISLPELIARYPVEKKVVREERGPAWKRDKKIEARKG